MKVRPRCIRNERSMDNLELAESLKTLNADLHELLERQRKDRELRIESVRAMDEIGSIIGAWPLASDLVQ